MATLPAHAQTNPPHGTPGQPRVMPTPAPLPLPSNLEIPAYKPGPNPFRDGETLLFRASWMGVPAADAKVLISHNKLHPEWWTGVMWLNTSEVVDLVYPMRDVFKENFDSTSLHPNDITIVQHGGTWQGQRSGFFMVPDRNFAMTVLTNSEGGAPLLNELFAEDWALRRANQVDGLGNSIRRRGTSIAVLMRRRVHDGLVVRREQGTEIAGLRGRP